jgi:hypothetical protein
MKQKNLSKLVKTAIVLFIVNLFVVTHLMGQSVDDQLASQIGRTAGTGGSYSGYWSRIATCTNGGGYEDFGTVFELFGNGSADNRYFFGKLIARFKRQASDPGPATNVSLVLMDSNIGAENIKGIMNGATIDIYVKINASYTNMGCRRIAGSNSLITLLTSQPLVEQLPAGNTINCDEWSNISNNFEVTGSNSPIMKVVNTNANANAEAVFKSSYSIDGEARERSARLELGTADLKGSPYYDKVWSVESFDGDSWGNSPEFRINRGITTMLKSNNLGNFAIGGDIDNNYKLSVNGSASVSTLRVAKDEQSMELNSDIMGRCHEILFGATRTKGSDWLNNSAAYTHNAGSYNSGAGAIRFVGNGGQMDFFISPVSTGAGNKVEWGSPVMTMLRNGNVGIGTSGPGNKLEVNGTIRAKEVKVEAENWPDYVFGKEYKLADLAQVEQYITSEGHLPDMPAAETVEKEGVNLAEMNKLLVKKIEELTLYMIQQQKEIEALKCTINKK